MTAPAAPTIRVISTGTAAVVRWRAVEGADTYNVYTALGGAAAFRTLRATVDATDDVLDDGTYEAWLGGRDLSLAGEGILNITATAVNAGAEESDASNSVQRYFPGEDGGSQDAAVADTAYDDEPDVMHVVFDPHTGTTLDVDTEQYDRYADFEGLDSSPKRDRTQAQRIARKRLAHS